MQGWKYHESAPDIRSLHSTAAAYLHRFPHPEHRYSDSWKLSGRYWRRMLACEHHPHLLYPQFKQVAHPSIRMVALVLHLWHIVAPGGNAAESSDVESRRLFSASE